MRHSRFGAWLTALCLSCGGATASHGPDRVQLPVGDGTTSSRPSPSPTKVAPPPSGPAKDVPFPRVVGTELGSGVRLRVVPLGALPIVQLRVLVRAGTSHAPPGVAELTAAMLKDGGAASMASAEVLRRVETLGATLGITTDADSTVLSVGVPREFADEAMSLLADVVTRPRFDAGEFGKRKSRDADAALDRARTDGSWTATRIVFRELYGPAHPYGTFGVVPSEVAKVDLAQIKEFYRKHYVPKGTTLVVAGDIEADAAKSLATRHFGHWQGGPPPAPRPPGTALEALRRHVVVAHRPRSAQSDVFVALRAPERRTETWAAVRVANHVLGGGVASRLFADVREERSLAYRTSAQIFELRDGPQPLVLYAGTETKKTADAVLGLLDNLARMVSTPPSEAEVEGARRYLGDVLAIRMETIGSIADMVVVEESLDLGPDYYDVYKRKVRATTAADAEAIATHLYLPEHAIVVVSGDADTIAPALARFGDVTVVDPEHDFRPLRTVPKANP